jgi:hypothetical protein
LVQRCSHSGVVRPPETSMPSPGFFVASVPCVGEQVLANHSVYFQVVAVARSVRGRPKAASTPAPITRGGGRVGPLSRRRIHGGIVTFATQMSGLESAPVATADVDEYLRGLEEPKRGTLEALRRTILEIVPEAEQVISYRVPAFRVRGRTVAGFAHFGTT